MEGKTMNRGHAIAITIAAVLLLLLAPACTTDYWPTITSLQAQADWVAPGGSLRVTCTARDSGGGLTYQWSASGGSIAGTGAAVDWTAPQAVGMYDITVKVTNSQGRQTTESLALAASNGPPPVIQSLVPTARDHEYLKTSTAGYMAARIFEYDIECVASAATGELVYQWSCTDGEISGDGPAIMWTAPDRDGRVTVTVKAVDSAGNWVSKSLVFDVVDCESCVVW
jgi:hypothetical protein